MGKKHYIPEEVDLAILKGLKPKWIAEYFDIPVTVINNRKREIKGKNNHRKLLKDDFGGAF